MYLVYAGLKASSHVPSAKKKASELADQAKRLFTQQLELFGQVNENTNGVLGVGSDSVRADSALDAETLTFFTSDNGAPPNHAANQNASATEPGQRGSNHPLCEPLSTLPLPRLVASLRGHADLRESDGMWPGVASRAASMKAGLECRPSFDGRGASKPGASRASSLQRMTSSRPCSR